MNENPIEEITVYSLESFLPEIVPTLAFDRIPIYRGQARSSWAVLPALLREDLAATEFGSWTDLESSLLTRWKQRARNDLAPEPATELEWMALGQHHGLPTRLTAWSENALVALWYATAPDASGDDGVVWRILPGDDSLCVRQDYEQIPDRIRLYQAPRRSAAQRNQRTICLSHPVPEDSGSAPSLEEYLAAGRERLHVARITVPESWKRSLREELSKVGVDSYLLNPGLGGLCEQIGSEIYRHTDSYEWVFPQ
jgi:hypothetical protein